MLKRDEYKDKYPNKDYTFTRYNEPIFRPKFDLSLIFYPDMKSLYKSFRTRFINNKELDFILTTGCEASLRISFEVIKRFLYNEGKKVDFVYQEYPTWGMVPVIADQVFYKDKLQKLPFIYNKDRSRFEYKEDIYFVKDTTNVLYTTYDTNNLFSHKNKIFTGTPDVWQVMDFSYTEPSIAINEYSKLLDIVDHNNRLIMIGGFSKHISCSCRLGFIVFPVEYKDIFNLYREEYVSSSAVYELMNYDIRKESSTYIKENSCCVTDSHTVTDNRNFSTVLLDKDTNPTNVNKKFKVGEYEFARCGKKITR